MHQEYSIECDNEQCDYKIKSPTGDPNEDISGYVNTPCPQCGENLLTEQDHVQSLKLLGIINWLSEPPTTKGCGLPHATHKLTLHVLA